MAPPPTPMTTATAPAPIDVRRIAPPDRHPLIFATFDALGPGEAFEIVNDHDPLPLYFQFEAHRLGLFTWRYLESGPERWHVRIGRTAAAGDDARTEPSGCCGGCTCREG